MKTLTSVEKGIFFAGMMLPIIAFIVNQRVKLSDPVYGFLTGIGIGLEILILWRQAKRKKTLQKSKL